MILRSGETADIDGILSLQERNLYSNLSAAERLKGFLTTPFTPAQIETLLEENGVFVALDDDLIAGYAMAGSWTFFSQWPIFPYMVSRLPALRFMGQPLPPGETFQYGPVCIDEKLRGSNLFPRLFEVMRLAMADRYPVGVTFINRVNQRSYNAHTRKLGMTVVDQFEFDGRPYYSLAFDTHVSVLK